MKEFIKTFFYVLLGASLMLLAAGVTIFIPGGFIAHHFGIPWAMAYSFFTITLWISICEYRRGN